MGADTSLQARTCENGYMSMKVPILFRGYKIIVHVCVCARAWPTRCKNAHLCMVVVIVCLCACM